MGGESKTLIEDWDFVCLYIWFLKGFGGVPLQKDTLKPFFFFLFFFKSQRGEIRGKSICKRGF